MPTNPHPPSPDARDPQAQGKKERDGIGLDERIKKMASTGFMALVGQNGGVKWGVEKYLSDASHVGLGVFLARGFKWQIDGTVTKSSA